jgi:hypothetical protein
MKAKFIFLIFLLVSLLSFGQGNYKSFIHSGVTKWLYYSPQDGCSMDEVDAYGDTLINQFTYKKLWDIYFVPQPPYDNTNQQWRDYTQFTGLTNTFIRQSNDSSKLYLFDGTDNVEYLIADMNLKVGDEFILPKLGSFTVKSIYYQNGLKNIQFDDNSPWHELTFIEGVGLNTHFKSLLTNFGGYPYNYLICYSNSSYFFNTQGICGCVDTKIEEIKTDKYKIRRQSDLIEISFDRIAQRTWEVFDIYGRGIQKANIVNQQSIQIPISGLKNGIYVLLIYNLNNRKYMSMKLFL